MLIACAACATAPAPGTLLSGTVTKSTVLQMAGLPTDEPDRALAPLRREPPGFAWVTCRRPEPGTGSYEVRVTVRYDVTVRGETANIRVTDAPDPCFEPFAIEAVWWWRFAPRIVGGRVLPSVGETNTITFSYENGIPAS